MENQWISRTNIYEVNLRQYTPQGTIRAFLQHLPRLRDMGVETLWFMPLTPIAVKNRKGSLGSYYACSDFLAVADEFGNLDDWKELVQQAHDLGFKVILDWVANHTGWDHVWTKEHPDWYKKDDHTGDFKIASGMDDIIELDFDNREMRMAMVAAMKFWLNTGIDGFRCDLAFWVRLDFWVEAKAALQKEKDLFWLGELDVLENPEYMQVFDAAYTWRWMHKAEKFYKEFVPFHELRQVLTDYLNAPGIKAWFTSNHDENSWNGTEYEKYGALAPALMVLSCTWPGLPLIYSGQELPNHKRLEFFEKDPIEWQGEPQLHGFFKTLLNLRSQSAALSAVSPVELLNAGQDDLLAYKRSSGTDEIVVLINFSEEIKNFRIENLAGRFTEVFSGREMIFNHDTGIGLQAYDYLVLQKK